MRLRKELRENLGVSSAGRRVEVGKKTAMLRIALLKRWQMLFKDKINFIVGKRAPVLKTLL